MDQGYVVTYIPKRLWPINETTAFLQHHKHKERTASGGMYGLRLCSYVRPQTPMTYEQDNCRANTPTDKDKDSCQYAYEYDPIAGIILPPEWPRR